MSRPCRSAVTATHTDPRPFLPLVAMRVRSMSRVGAAAAAALLLLATLCAPLSARAQMQVPKPRTAAAGENQFNPRNGGAAASDEFCGNGNTALNNLAAPIVSEAKQRSGNAATAQRRS